MAHTHAHTHIYIYVQNAFVQFMYIYILFSCSHPCLFACFARHVEQPEAVRDCLLRNGGALALKRRKLAEGGPNKCYIVMKLLACFRIHSQTTEIG